MFVAENIFFDETKNSNLQCFENNKDQVEDLDQFLLRWDKAYQEKLDTIDMFIPEKNKHWTKAQVQHFVKVFYHCRGHFGDFLWYLGNFAPNREIKKIVLHNIAEEFNGNHLSHEQLYLDFAQDLGVDLSNESIKEEYYPSRIREFNLSHKVGLKKRDWQGGFAMFSAYERLDRIDYAALMQLPFTQHEFFIIHSQVAHFETTCKVLQEIWTENFKKIKEAFNFISEIQLKMWKDLSDGIFAYKAPI